MRQWTIPVLDSVDRTRDLLIKQDNGRITFIPPPGPSYAMSVRDLTRLLEVATAARDEALGKGQP